MMTGRDLHAHDETEATVMTMAPIVYVVDDDQGVRKSLELLLKSVEIATRSYAGAREFLQDYDKASHGCLILDIRMPGMSGLELQQQLNQSGVTLPVIIVTAHADVPIALQAMKAGAFDFIEKPYSDQLLLERIRAALEQDRLIRKQLAKRENLEIKFEKLTPREKQVMALVSEGHQNKEIARQLGLSVKTVEVHRANFMAKLDVHSLAELLHMTLVDNKH